MSLLGVAEFAPDRPDLAEATRWAHNVVPMTPESYGPRLQFQRYSTNPLPDQCIGMGFGETPELVHNIFAGTTATIQRIISGTTTWVDVSGTGGYTTAPGEFWEFTPFKTLMIATNYTNPIQVFDEEAGGTFSELSPDAPRARHLAVAKNFLIVANTSDPVGGTNPMRIWWSGNGTPNSWPTPGSTTAQQEQSDYTDIPGTMGQIQALAPNLAGCDCGIVFERGVQRMIYVGPPDIFNIYAAASVRGTPSPRSVVWFGELIYYLGEDGFYAFDGSVAVPIGANKVDKFFFDLVDHNAFNIVIGDANTVYKAIVWIFRSVHAPTLEQDSMLIYRWDIQRWSYSPLPGVEWIERMPSLGDALGGLSRAGSGQLLLGGIDYDHYLGYFTGPPVVPAIIGTKVVQITQNQRTFVNYTRPLVDSGAPANYLLTEALAIITTEDGEPLLTESGSAVMTVALSARNTYQETEIFGPEVPPDISGNCTFRSDGRYHRGRITISQGLWTTMAGLDVRGIPAGIR